jgi:hypothetical protein
MNKLFSKLKTTFKKINIKSKKTWTFFGVIGIGIVISTILLSYGYYVNTGTKQVVVSGTAITRASDIVLQIYTQDRDSSGNAISNSYSRSYYIPTNNYTYESAKTVCGTGITLTYDSANHQFRLESTQRGVCKVYFAADGTVVPNAEFSINVEQTLNGGNYREMGELPDNDYVYTINTTRTTCTDPNAVVSIVNRQIQVVTSMDLDCTIYVDIQSVTGGGLPSIATYLQNNNPAGYRGSSHSDSATQNMYRFVGGYQSTDAGYAGSVNNYICLGSDAATCPDDNMYRIIGVVAENDSTTGLQADMIKVIKNNSIGYYIWTGGTDLQNLRYTTNWTENYLNTNILNQSYLNSLLFKDKIVSVKWHCYTGNTHFICRDTSVLTADSEYSADLCSNTSTKISLMYAGDYKNSYNNGQNESSSWMLKCTDTSHTTEHSISNEWNYTYLCSQWTMAYEGSESCAGGSGNFAWGVEGNGYATADYYYTYDEGYLESWIKSVRPVFYLNKNIKLVSGSGTYASPFRIA